MTQKERSWSLRAVGSHFCGILEKVLAQGPEWHSQRDTGLLCFLILEQGAELRGFVKVRRTAD